MKDIVYQINTKDNKEIIIYDDGTYDNNTSLEIGYVFNRFQPHIDTEIARGVVKITAEIQKKITTFIQSL